MLNGCCFMWLLSHASSRRNVVCCGAFACQASAQKWPLFSTSALKWCSGECNAFRSVHCLWTEDLPFSCGCYLAHVSKGSKVYKLTQTGVWVKCAQVCACCLCAFWVPLTVMTYRGQRAGLVALIFGLAEELLIGNILFSKRSCFKEPSLRSGGRFILYLFSSIQCSSFQVLRLPCPACFTCLTGKTS